MAQPPPQRSAGGGLAWRDLATAAVMFGIAAWVWVETAGWGEARNLAQDPSVLPRSIAVALLAAGLVLVVRQATRVLLPTPGHGGNGATVAPDSHHGEGGVEAEPDEPPGTPQALLLFAGIAVYAWAAFRIGYAVTTWVFLVATVALLGGERSPLRLGLAGLVAAVGTAAVWLGFTELLNVRMPSTWLP